MKWLRRDKLFNDSLRMLSISQWRRRLLFWGGGLTVGLACVGFAIVCDYCNTYFMTFALKHSLWPMVVTPLGFMLIVLIMRWLFHGAEGSGIPQVIAALQLNSPRSRVQLVSLRIAIGKFLLTMLGFMCGGSIGREGPTIQMSASIMQFLSKVGNFHRHDMQRGLLLAGGAAGIAAAFNAPLAGVVFAIEELAGSFERGLSGTIITTVVLCGIVAQYVLGNYIYFGTSHATLDIVHGGWIPLIICAIIGGVLGGVFSELLIRISWVMKNVVMRNPIWVAGALGLAVAIIGWAAHGTTYGSGYQAAKSIIDHNHVEAVPLFYGFMKMIVTLLTYLSGIPGGIFAPSLSAGAGFGHMLAGWFPIRFQDAIILMTTVAYFSGVVQSPITCFVIVLEMTASASGNMVLPIMISSLIANAVSRTICRESLYHALSKRYINAIKAKNLAEFKEHQAT